ncbi:Beta-N-acetylglucosaminidase [Clostridium acidisoli DSM 12555]|uniref:Beta-N-acetylglucosaminidase n=1 Tax=Clostridium acidisoli DSM 12555 TaxID=1121291 RepID=A0A1W1XAS9_9CLOT|nr:Ig-like domain-containing protein [Clostridium acidisoli]SMC20960.1 Beta-N-acetylglucosaminidase [Clostridium acidisoli DSM 12555]
MIKPLIKKKIVTFLCVIAMATVSINVPVKTFASTNNALPARLWIDTPQNNSKQSSNQLNVSGWALSENGVKSVQVALDGGNVQNATLGGARPDVANFYQGYTGGANSGYSANLDISTLSYGTHTVTVTSTGNDGSTRTLDVAIYKANLNSNNLPARLWIDSPQSNSKQSSNQLNVSGWALSQNGVKSVQVAVDGKGAQNATLGGARPDVANFYQGYTGGANSGYSTNIDISSLSYGIHTVTVTSIGNDGSTRTLDTSIYKINAATSSLPASTFIDTPTSKSNVFSVNNKVSVSGWSIDGSGMQKVQVYVDNSYKGDANIGISRPDVAKVYPSYYQASTSGFNYDLDISSIPDGTHTITVRGTGNDGANSSESVSVTKVSSNSMVPRIFIDTPSYAQVSGGNVTVSGWSLNLYGVQKVQVYVDNNYKGDANIGISRPDVNNFYTGYTGASTSGYTYNLSLNGLSAGAHTVTVKSIGNDGSVTPLNSQVYVLPSGVSNMSSRVWIDTPSNGTFYKTSPGQVILSGWSLSPFGVQRVEVFYDTYYIGDASIGLARPDVNSFYPGYVGGANSGYSFNLNLSNISDGVHTITVKNLGTNNDSASVDIKIYKFSGNGQSTIYNTSLQNAVTKQMTYGDPVMESNGNWIAADKNTVQKYMDPTNFMDSYGVYQFLRLDYMQGVTVDDLNNILAGKGVLAGKGAQFLDAAQQSNINPVYLVSHALLETGNGQSALATGIVVNGKKTYNLFGIGAYDSNPNQMGAQYAYNQGWFSVDQAIYGGAQWISGSYINNSFYKQNTLYKMRWNPASPTNHQYATDVRWAYNQIYNIKSLIDQVQKPVLQFDIPQYN